MHHIVCDGSSLNIFIKDLCDLYNNKTLPDCSLSYKDFAVWENNSLLQGSFDESKNYWLSQFEDDIPVLNMPTNFSRPAENSFKGAKVYDSIDSRITASIKDYAMQNGLTPYMILLASYYILLYKYSMQNDIVIGSPIVGRVNAELNNIIGMFVNTLPLRLKFDSKLSIKELLAIIKDMCLNSFRHQAYPFDEIVKNLRANRNNSHSPLFDVLFTYQNEGLSNINLGNIKAEYYLPDPKVSKFDLSLEVVPTNEVFNINFEYSTDLFNNDFVKRLSVHYLNILKQMLKNPEQKIAEIDMLSIDERTKILYDFNDTQLPYPEDRTIASLFEEQVQRTPDKIAIICNEKMLSYSKLNEKANQLARFLINQGVREGDNVGIMLPRSLEVLVSMVAILKIGACYVPIDPSYPSSRIEYIVSNSNIKVLLSNNSVFNNIKVPLALDVSLEYQAIYSRKF